MHRLNVTASSRLTLAQNPDIAVVRTYRQIAEILVTRGDRDMTATRAARICQLAERKIAEALWGDSNFRRQLRLGDREPLSHPSGGNGYHDEPWIQATSD